MVKQSKKTPAELQNTYAYQVDKMTYIVTPVYREDSGKSIHDLMLNLMKKEAEKPGI